MEDHRTIAVSDAHLSSSRPRRSLCKALNAENVQYALIGGFAVILQGFVRGTKDIDLLVEAASENVRRLKRAMAVFLTTRSTSSPIYEIGNISAG